MLNISEYVVSPDWLRFFEFDYFYTCQHFLTQLPFWCKFVCGFFAYDSSKECMPETLENVLLLRVKILHISSFLLFPLVLKIVIQEPPFHNQLLCPKLGDLFKSLSETWTFAEFYEIRSLFKWMDEAKFHSSNEFVACFTFLLA